MKHLTKSDLVNIDAFKALLRLVSNDITAVKQSDKEPSAKSQEIFKLYRQKAQLIQQATDKYPEINWINEALGDKLPSETEFYSLAKIKARVTAENNHRNNTKLEQEL